jgi:hypothetical protein
MSKINLARSMKTVKSVVTANSPVLLLGTSIAGVVTTAIVSARAGYKARGIIDAKQAEQPDVPLTKKDMASLTWLCYAVPGVTAASTIAGVTGLHMVHSKRNAALAGLYALSMNKLDDVQEEAEKLLGTKKSQQLSDNLAQKNIDRHPGAYAEPAVTGGGTDLWYDTYTDRFFYSSMNEIARGVNDANAFLLSEGDLDLNMFYDRIGLNSVPFGTEVGWSGEAVNVQYGSVLHPDGRSAGSITFRDEPRADMGRAK